MRYLQKAVKWRDKFRVERVSIFRDPKCSIRVLRSKYSNFSYSLEKLLRFTTESRKKPRSPPKDRTDSLVDVSVLRLSDVTLEHPLEDVERDARSAAVPLHLQHPPLLLHGVLLVCQLQPAEQHKSSTQYREERWEIKVRKARVTSALVGDSVQKEKSRTFPSQHGVNHTNGT